MRIEDMMTRRVRTCFADESLEDAAKEMWDADVGCLVVVDPDRRPVGIITDRDIAMAAYIQGLRLRDARVRTAMSSHVVTCFPGTSLHEVEKHMQTAQIRRVPVIDSEGKLAGIVALGDVARNAQWCRTPATELPSLAQTLAAVTGARQGQAAAAQ